MNSGMTPETLKKGVPDGDRCPPRANLIPWRKWECDGFVSFFESGESVPSCVKTPRLMTLQHQRECTRQPKQCRVAARL
ncbi:MAG: hypothetical protein M2R45_01635 [Verrucomicrobia subdivision 3 bacterium]|nr:hypothetical protein [Limisphaerales bacterium]MCS1412786.1 hypothetical protein [Limisphaerales bacterium]